MAEDLTIIVSKDKERMYRSLIPQIECLLSDETYFIANMAYVCAALKEQFNWFWVGFYLVKNDVLVLAPFGGRLSVSELLKDGAFAAPAGQKRKY